MAMYVDKSRIHEIEPHKDFEKEYNPGETIKFSGIYYCIHCNREIACNKDDPFPPQNHHQHSSSRSIRWRLLVETGKPD